MIDSRKLITVVIGGLVVTAVAYADMVSVSRLDAEPRQLPHVYGRTDLQYTNLSSPSNFSSVGHLDLWSVEFLPEANADVSQTSDIQHPLSLTNGQGSLNLCLSALIGLGVAGWKLRKYA